MIANISEKELLEYDGISCLPDDFDEYWKRALDEMNAVDPELDIKKADLNFKNVECFEIYFTGVRGGRIYCHYMRPVNAKKCPIIFKAHGYSGHMPYWTDMLIAASQGFCTMYMDCRGQGGKSTDTTVAAGNTLRGHIIRGVDNDSPDDLYYRQVFLDMAQMVKIAEGFDEVDKERMYTMGGSQGGALALVCAALCPQIKKAAIYYPFLSDYKYAYKCVNGSGAGAFYEFSEYFRQADPRHEKADEVFRKLGYIDIQNLAPYVKAEVIMASGLLDNAVPVKTHFAMYNKLKTKKRHYIYPERGHEALDGMDDIVYQWFNE